MAIEVKRRRRRAAPVGIAPSEPERDILDQYLYEVSTYPLLKGTEEIDVARKIRAGDPDALQELVKRNLRFVISVAKKYQNRGLPLIDLIGEGNVGLLTAARKFDPDQGVKFISYAVWWIRQAILKALGEQGLYRIPGSRVMDLRTVQRARAIWQCEHDGDEPDPVQLQDVTGLSEERLLNALFAESSRATLSLDTCGVTQEDDFPTRLERLPSPDPDPEQRTEYVRMHAILERHLGDLPTREQRILCCYFGLRQETQKTLEEIGRTVGLTRERVRQLRDKALQRLRNRLDATEQEELLAAYHEELLA